MLGDVEQIGVRKGHMDKVTRLRSLKSDAKKVLATHHLKITASVGDVGSSG
jgi:hypothetical protein